MNSISIDKIKAGEKIVFCYGPGQTPMNPGSTGKAYGFLRSRFGDQLRVKVTDERGNVTWNYVSSLYIPSSIPGVNPIGAYYIQD